MKIITCSTPAWFTGMDIFLQLLFAFVTLFIAFYAYKVYKISRQKSSLFFGVGFLSWSFAYFIGGLLNLFLLLNVQTTQLVGSILSPTMVNPLQLSVLAVWFHILGTILGLSLLAHVTLKDRSNKIFLLILALSSIGLLFTANLSVEFHLIASVLLLFITAQHYQRLEKKKNSSTLSLFLGFGFLFLGTVQLGLANSMDLLYISGHIITFIGYLLLLRNLLRVVKK